MKYLTQLFLIGAVICFGLVPAGWCAEQSGDDGSGFIVVTNPPVADFYTSNRYSAAPFTVSFFDASRGAVPMTYSWDFGDGTTSAHQHPTHTFKADGEYSVRLTVTNQYSSDTRTMEDYIGVGNPPLADFSASPREGTLPLTVVFADLSKNKPTAWYWDFGDGTSSTEQAPSHVYVQPGLYSVRMRVTNNFGSDALSQTGFINASSPVPVPVTVPAAPVKERAEGIIGLIQEAKGTTEKNLPTASFIPPQFMALAAVLTSIAVLIIQVIAANIGFIWQFLLKFAKFFSDIIFGHAVEKLSEKEIAVRKLAVRKMERHYFGLSATEVLVIEIAILIVALAFMFADRAELTLEMVLIYIAVGAVSVVLHDFAHRYFATKHGQDADTQFWGLGTFIMFVTAWLFGNAFGASYRNLVNRNDDEDPKKIGLEMVAGPVVSIVLTFVFLGMVALGGTWAIAGGIGFTINLITAVYSLMPIETMDGLAIWRWNRPLYFALLIPMIAFYFFTFMAV